LIDGDVTEIKAKSREEFFVSTSKGSVFHFRYVCDRSLDLVRKWSGLALIEEVTARADTDSIINNFDFDAGCDELCCVGDDGTINFISLYETKIDPVSSFGKLTNIWEKLLGITLFAY
jgi:hypothetical protein